MYLSPKRTWGAVSSILIVTSLAYSKVQRQTECLIYNRLVIYCQRKPIQTRHGANIHIEHVHLRVCTCGYLNGLSHGYG